jgi:hypothetical protein
LGEIIWGQHSVELLVLLLVLLLLLLLLFLTIGRGCSLGDGWHRCRGRRRRLATIAADNSNGQNHDWIAGKPWCLSVLV